MVKFNGYLQQATGNRKQVTDKRQEARAKVKKSMLDFIAASTNLGSLKNKFRTGISIF